MIDYIDEIEITVESGAGGNGISSFRREKFVPFGGPDGGNGGEGGSVYFKGNSNLNSFRDLIQNRFYKANKGENGRGSNKNGKNGKDMIIQVPLGTEVIDSKSQKVLIDVIENDKSYLAIKGGKGGLGNSNFKTSRNQSPKKSTQGEKGNKIKVVLNLKTLSNIGIVGFPNVGKSSLISLITNSKAEVANYPFTTLTPNLGVIKTLDKDYLIADIPGIVEDASKGKGLGIKFLKHIERSENIIIVLDASCEKIEELNNQYKKLIKEIKSYSKSLPSRIKMIIINKYDLCKFKDQLCNLVLDKNIKQVIFSCIDSNKHDIEKLKKNLLF